MLDHGVRPPAAASLVPPLGPDDASSTQWQPRRNQPSARATWNNRHYDPRLGSSALMPLMPSSDQQRATTPAGEATRAGCHHGPTPQCRHVRDPGSVGAVIHTGCWTRPGANGCGWHGQYTASARAAVDSRCAMRMFAHSRRQDVPERPAEEPHGASHQTRGICRCRSVWQSRPVATPRVAARRKSVKWAVVLPAEPGRSLVEKVSPACTGTHPACLGGGGATLRNGFIWIRKTSCAIGFCHPEPKAKDLAPE
jgi:hypothetical protein